MATIPLAGFTTPFLPNSGFAIWDTDSVPEQPCDKTVSEAAEGLLISADVVDLTVGSAYQASPPVVRVLTEIQTDGELRTTLDCPVIIDDAVETHLTKRHWLFGSLSAINTSNTGTIIRAVSRLLNRISKINRGVN